MKDGRSASLWAPWAGLLMGAAAWFAHHQAGSEVNYWDCRAGGPGFVIALGVACAATAVIGGMISWRARRRTEGVATAQNRQFAAMVGTAGAAVFLLAITFQTLAGALVPACLR